MTNKIKFFSRHEVTAEQKELLLKAVKACSSSFEYIAFDYDDMGEDPNLMIDKAIEIKQISIALTPMELINGPDGVIEEDCQCESIVAGVFPVETIMGMLHHAQRLNQSIEIITFKFERDRTGKDGNCTVLALKSAMIYGYCHITRELKFPLEVDV